jgi:predicted transcriptional regulator
MKKIRRRDKMKIFGDLLSVLQVESSNKIVITKITSKSNIPFTRLKKYISDLKELGLIEDEMTLKLTEKGKEYLDQYKTVLAFMKSMGMSYKDEQN